MGRAIGILMLIGLAALVVFFSVPLWKVPYFTTKELSYEALAYIERDEPGERVDEEYIVPYSFPIGRVVIKNTEKPIASGEMAFSEDQETLEAKLDISTRLIFAEGDERQALLAELYLLEVANEDKARMAILIEEYGRMTAFFRQHFSFKPDVWEEKPVWERWGRSILAKLPLSGVWGRYIPAFKYGFTRQDAWSLQRRVASEMEALRDKNKVRSHIRVSFSFYSQGETYSRDDGISLRPGEAGTLEFRVWQVNMDEDEWSWEYEVIPDRKWVTDHKRVTPFRYLLHKLESP